MAEGFCSKVTAILRKLYKGLKSLTGLIILLVLYNIIGAVIFVELEAPYEKKMVIKEKPEHKELILLLTNITVALSNSEFETLRNKTFDLINQYGFENMEGKSESTWDFWKALFFCATIYTTIGYGNIYPKTDAGKVAAIFYAVFGIPLAMKVLAVLGKKLMIILNFFYLLVKKCFKCNGRNNNRYTVQDKQADNGENVELSEIDKSDKAIKIEQENKEDKIKQEIENKLPIAVPIVILIIYIFLGAIMYTLWEDWGFLDAFYFVFISVSTIGFGDITPAHTKFFIVSSIYVFIGLALVSMCINVLIDFYIMSIKLAIHQVDVVTSTVKKGCRCGSRRQSVSCKMTKGFRSNAKNIIGQVYNGFKSLTGLIILLMVYSFTGAVIFVYVETPYQDELLLAQEPKHKNMVQLLLNLTVSLNSPEFENLRDDIVTLMNKFDADNFEKIHGKRWDFWKALFFCGTIYTAIGYGDIYPRTDAGKVIAILYAIFGIPLAFRVLAEIGKKLTTVIKFFYFGVKRSCAKNVKTADGGSFKEERNDIALSTEHTEKENNDIEIVWEDKDETLIKEIENRLPLVVPVIILFVYLFLGALMYTRWEDWSYLDAFYFTFISVSTIGFGDITPAHTKYFIVTSIYVFVGLALVSVCINVFMEFYIVSIKVAAHQMNRVGSKIIKGCHGCRRRQSL
ncbi:uncharacterized protein [Mytilus edulis]|uniref:uncharacterized protein n=1 Tax=Mytilus edulis TaxID=6550 RepID=UPI0039EFBE9A